MSVHILDSMAREGFEEVIALQDRDSGLRAFLAIHDTRRGPAFGGMRRWEYRDEREALLDCLRLARAMTHKCALADLPAGGAKLVILARPDTDLEGAYAHIGRFVERLRGRFYTGPDVGTGARELGWASAETGFVTDPGPEGPGELAECTAEGVFRSMEAALVHVDRAVDWPRRSVVVQGLGDVGLRLARKLVRSQARVFGADIDASRAEAASSELGIELVDPAGDLELECDIFAPCALGGILHDLSVERLRARIVCGAANNVLAQPVHGERLFERGILFAPDFVVNSGALIRGVHFHLEGRRESVETVGERIGMNLAGLLDLAASEGIPPERAAEREAERRIRG